MPFDFRVFVGHSFDGYQQTVPDLLHSMDMLDIEMSLVCPLKPLSYDLDQANVGLAVSIKEYPDRLIGAARIDPWQPDASESLRMGLETLGLRALFLHPWEENFQADMDSLDRLLEIAEHLDVPVLVATGYPWLSSPLHVAELAQRWPRVPVVMTNGGQINISGLGQADATLALSKATNLHIDTAGVYRQDFIEETVTALGAERVLFATGAPYFDQRYEIRRVLYANVDDSKRKAMIGGNARRLLGLGQ